MTKLLETYLKIGFEEPRGTELSKILDREVPRQLTAWHDGKIEPVRELLVSTAIESTTLVQTEMYNTVMEGARLKQCMRQALPVIKMNANALTIPYGATSTYADMVAEGAEVPISTQDYNTITLTAHKYGVRPMVTDEMVEDGLYDVMAMEIAYAGESIENEINRLALTELLDGASAETDCDVGGTPTIADAGIKAIAAAAGAIKGYGFLPDTVILAPGAATVLMQEFVPTGYAGAESVMGGNLPSLLGMKVFTCGVADASSTYTWGYSSDGYIGMIVMDSRKAGAIGMRRDITIEQIRDPIRQLKSATVTARFDADSVLADAICRIEY